MCTISQCSELDVLDAYREISQLRRETCEHRHNRCTFVGVLCHDRRCYRVTDITNTPEAHQRVCDRLERQFHPVTVFAVYG